jgi:hypothetical protein
MNNVRNYNSCINVSDEKLNQGYEKNRPSQQLFKVFILYILRQNI